MSNVPITIPIVGLPASDPTPGVFLELDLAQGPPAGASVIYGALLMANRMTTGDATVDSVVYGPYGNSPAPFATENDVINRSGRGSEMHRKWKRFVRTNGSTPVFGIFVSESSGSKASLQINIGGSDATSAGTMRTYLVGESVDATIASGDSAGTVVTSVVNAVNSMGDWPVTAAANVATLTGTVSVTQTSATVTFSQSQTLAAGTAIVFGSQSSVVYYLANAVSGTSGTLTVAYSGTTNAATTTTVQAVILTAKQKGPRGNWLRSSMQLISGAGTTSFTTAQTFFTGGTTADSNTTALATILASRYYYLVPAAEDQTQLSALSAQVTIQAQAKPGLRQTIVAASIDTESNAQTIAIALNQARAELVWMEKSDWVPSEMAAHHASLYSLGEGPDGVGGPSLHNFNGLGGGPGAGSGNPLRAQIDPLYAVPYPRGWTAKPTPTTIVGAIQNGLSPVTADAQTGKTYLVMRVTTRTLTSGITDYRIRWPHKVRVCDFYGDQLISKLTLQFGGMDIVDNLVAGQKLQNNTSTTPKNIENAIDALTDTFAAAGHLQNADAIKAGTYVIREQNPTTRVSARIPASTIDTLDQIALQLLQVA